MKIKNQQDFWAGMMFLLVGVAFAWGSTEYSFGTSARPGPGYFPFGLGIILSVLGLIELFKALTIESEGGGLIGDIGWKPLGIIVLSVVVFGWGIPHLGMWIALPLLIIICSLAGDEFHWGSAIAEAVVITIFSWLVFIKGLNLVIPLLPPAFSN